MNPKIKVSSRNLRESISAPRQDSRDRLVFDEKKLEENIKLVESLWGEENSNFLIKRVFTEELKDTGNILKILRQDADVYPPAGIIHHAIPSMVVMTELLNERKDTDNSIAGWFTWFCVYCSNARKAKSEGLFKGNGEVAPGGIPKIHKPEELKMGFSTVMSMDHHKIVEESLEPIASVNIDETEKTRRKINAIIKFPLRGMLYADYLSQERQKLKEEDTERQLNPIPWEKSKTRRADVSMWDSILSLYYLQHVDGPIFMPLHASSHYCLAVYDPALRICSFYDPLGSVERYNKWRDKYWIPFFTNFIGYYLDKTIIGRQKETMYIYNCISSAYVGKTTTHQQDGNNCGLFVCYYVMKACLPVQGEEPRWYIPLDESKGQKKKWIGTDPNCNSQFMYKVMRPALYCLFAKLYLIAQKEEQKQLQQRKNNVSRTVINP